MSLYLDINKIIDLSENPRKLSKLKTVLTGNNIPLAVSFAHVYETAKSKEHGKINQIINSLPYVQLTPLILIIDCEVKNEFYRFLKIDHRDSMPIFDAIFKNIPTDSGFDYLVNHAFKNTKEGKEILRHNEEHESKIKKSLANSKTIDIKQALLNERKNLVVEYTKEKLNPEKTSLRISLPHKSLDAEEFVGNFNFDNCPYLSFYTEFQTRRYADKFRKKIKEDLADIEHAVHGALSCEILVIEKNAGHIINQINERGIKIKAKIFSNLDDAIECLSL